MTNFLISMVHRIISGGQTGADRAGLDLAIFLSIEHGGWCPRNRRAEDGAIPYHYNLQETKDDDYPERTECNILDSDATIIFSKKKLGGGSNLTINLCQQHNKPYLLVRYQNVKTAANFVREFLTRNKPVTLNVAGTRYSHFPEIYQFTFDVLLAVLKEPEIAI